MKRYLIPLTCLALCLFCQIAAAESTLVKITRSDGKEITQVFFSFDTPPKYSYKVSAKRIDILLAETALPSDLQLFATDDRIIRVLPSTSADNTVLSLFFRYHPQKVKLEIASDGKLVLEVFLGTRDSGSYHDLAERLKGITEVMEEPVSVSNPLLSSPYAYDWNSFFKNYESAVDISVPIKFTAPPFPVMALIPPGLEKNMELLPHELRKLAGEQQWNGMLPQMRQMLDSLDSAKDVEGRKMLALTYGETLLRNNDFKGAYKQLYLLRQQYPNEHVGIAAGYLLTLLEARFQDPFLADYNYRKLEEIITPTYPLAPYFLLSRIETALATRQFERAQQLLSRDDTPFPADILKLRDLRQGDYYNSTGQLVRAIVSYQLLQDTPLLKAHPSSLNGYCNTLYRQKKYDLSADCYRALAPQVSAAEPLGLISYRTSMAELHFKPGNELISAFAGIEDVFPDTEAGFRAAIKQTDLKYLKDNKWARQAAKLYAEIAKNSVQRSTAAEAAFKEALIYSLIGEKSRSIDLLLDFLRDFRVSELRDTAYALIIDDLPGEIERLIGDGKYMEALVLAKRNSHLFKNNWLDESLMTDLAVAYQKIGIFSEAQRVYLYLLEISDAGKREQFFPPLIQSVFEQGNYSMVDEFASQYNYNYPDGKYTEPILILRIRAFLATGQYDEARKLLPTPLPATPEIHLLAAEIHFHDEDFKKTRELLEGLIAAKVKLPDDASFMLAESRYQTNEYPGAETLFSPLTDDEQFGPQALYRLAQIERSRGNEENALKLFTRIVEKGKDNPWKKLAERELEYSRLNSSINKMIGS